MTAPAGVRFDGPERVVHWTTAALVFVCIGTAAALYIPSLAVLIGRRAVVREIHVWTGIAIPAPVLLGAAGRWGRHLRADLGRLNRFRPADWVWLRSRGRRGGIEVGKFNPGQKLNASFLAGAALVMLATGSIMRWFDPFPDSWRTGATFVHDWTSFAMVVVIAGHVVIAVRHPAALRAMARGGPG